jgi:hypothetical protein
MVGTVPWPLKVTVSGDIHMAKKATAKKPAAKKGGKKK